MKKGALGMALFCLLVGAANIQAAIQPNLVNSLIVYEGEEPLSCEPDRVLLLRTGSCYSPLDPTRIDVCSRVYPDPYYPLGTVRYTDNCARLVGSITGVNWPGDLGNATYEIEFFTQAIDGPEPASLEPCVDHVKFVGTEAVQDFKHKSFSYFVYDMTDKRGCQVQRATLRFKASPWYSGAAQDGSFTAHIGVYDMQHACENDTTDDKRACFMFPPVSGAIPFTFPIDPSEFPAEDHVDCPAVPYKLEYKQFAVNVTSSVQADLNDPGASGFVGFMVGSEGFGANDIDAQPGMRTVGMTEFILEVEFSGVCGDGAGVPAFSQWGILVFMLGLLGLTAVVMRRKRAG